MKMSGPCFKQSDNIVVQFDGSVNINATFGSELQTTVTVPVLNKTGRLPVKLSIDGGNSFEHNGVFTSGIYPYSINFHCSIYNIAEVHIESLFYFLSFC